MGLKFVPPGGLEKAGQISILKDDETISRREIKNKFHCKLLVYFSIIVVININKLQI